MTAVTAHDQRVHDAPPAPGAGTTGVVGPRPGVDPGADVAGEPVRARTWFADHLSRRRWAVVATVAFVAVSLAFTFLWGPVVRHTTLWVIPGDIWSTYRNAHFVGWGDIGGIYDPTYGLLTFPAVVVVLAPVAMVSGHFGLTESIGLFTVTHPSAWFLLGPAILLLGSTSLFAFDALAEELGVARGTRILLQAVECVVLFQVVTLWGHPEDMVAVGLATYALIMGSRGRWRPAGWLWGAAIAFQPLVLVLVPVAFAVTPRGRRLRFCVRALVPSAVLLAIPLATQWHMTTSSLLHQSNRTDLDHPTPWVVLSTHLGPHTVSAGPGRMIALAAAVGLGWFAWRHRPSLLGLVWLGGLALALRCFFEAVLVPFYLGPPFAVLLVACAAAPGRRRLLVASTAMVVATVVSFHRLSEWAYWLPVVALLGVALVCAWPGRGALGLGGHPDRERGAAVHGTHGAVDAAGVPARP